MSVAVRVPFRPDRWPRTIPGHRFQAARVAAAATTAVVVCYLVAAIVLNEMVSRRLVGAVDARLSSQAAAVQTATSALGTSGVALSNDHDLDDAPTFLWAIGANGVPMPLTSGGPHLGRRAWRPGTAVIQLAGSQFRLLAIRSGGKWVVAGQSVAQIDRTRSALLGPEVLLGVGLVGVAFASFLIIGLRASAPLELVHRRQREFTADASHEIRTPLSVIGAEVDVALSRPRSVDAYQATLRRVDSEAQRLRQIVDDLLWLARADDPRTAAHERVVDVAAMAETSAERFGPVATAQEVALRADVGQSKGAFIRTDPRWVDRLIGVLVDNACKYVGHNGEVEVSVGESSGRVVLRVDDSGPGIAPEERPVVFDRFHRGIDEPGGLGLGLAIADSVVRASRGTWHIDDSPLGGARLEVSWRRAPTPRRSPPRTLEQSPDVGESQRRSLGCQYGHVP